MKTNLSIRSRFKSSFPIVAVAGIIMISLSSCLISIQGKGPKNDYKLLTEADKKQVIFVDSNKNICELPQDSTKIYAVTGVQLKNCLRHNDTSVIYRWSPNCKGKSCILIAACQEYCEAHNYKLYVVADYYDMKQMNAQNVAIEPILIANHFYYDKKYFNRINKLFMADLLGGEPSKKETSWCRFMLFKGDELIEYRASLYDM